MSVSGAGDPSKQIAVATEIVSRNLRHHLEPEDFKAMASANQTLMNHATLGLLLGGGIGVAYAMKGKNIGSFRSSTVGGLFYPTLAKRTGQRVIEEGREKVVDEGAELSRKTRTFFRSIGYGFVGSLAGLQLGVITGQRAGKKTLQTRPGSDARFKAALDGVTAELKAIGASDIAIAASNQMLRFPTPEKRPTGAGEMGFDTPDSDGSKGYQSDYSQGDSTARSNSPREDAAPDEPSRWEELRKARAAPPSSWDNIRQENARQNIPRNGNSNGSNGLGGDNFTASDKDAERRAFEDMMDQERKGGKDENQETTWRGR